MGIKEKKKRQNKIEKKKKQLTVIDKDVEKLEYWYTADTNANKCSHYGR